MPNAEFWLNDENEQPLPSAAKSSTFFGWVTQAASVHPEGRYGEFLRFSGGLKNEDY